MVEKEEKTVNEEEKEQEGKKRVKKKHRGEVEGEGARGGERVNTVEKGEYLVGTQG